MVVGGPASLGGWGLCDAMALKHSCSGLSQLLAIFLNYVTTRIARGFTAFLVSVYSEASAVFNGFDAAFAGKHGSPGSQA